HTRSKRDWSSDVCSSDLMLPDCSPGSTSAERVFVDIAWPFTRAARSGNGCGSGRLASAAGPAATDGEEAGVGAAEGDGDGEGDGPRAQPAIDTRTATTATRFSRMGAQARVPPGGSQTRPAVASPAMFSARTGDRISVG